MNKIKAIIKRALFLMSVNGIIIVLFVAFFGTIIEFGGWWFGFPVGIVCSICFTNYYLRRKIWEIFLSLPVLVGTVPFNIKLISYLYDKKTLGDWSIVITFVLTFIFSWFLFMIFRYIACFTIKKCCPTSR